MKTVTGARRIFYFNDPAPELLDEVDERYYEECQILGAPSVEVERVGQPAVVLSGTRFLSPDVTLGAVVVDGVLQVVCTRHGVPPVVMREFVDWLRYTVIRGAER